MQICMLHLKSYASSEKEDQTLRERDGPSNPASKTASLFLAEIVHPHRLLQLVLYYYTKFLKVPRKCPQTRGSSLESHVCIP